MSVYDQARANMVDTQLHPNGIVTPKLLEAYKHTPREKFVPENRRSHAYLDEDLPVGNGRYIMEPLVHAKLLELARICPGDIVLDIGGLYGYSAAVLSKLAETVVAVEEDGKALQAAHAVWQEETICNIVQVNNALSEGCPEYAPYSLIILNGAVSEIPVCLLEQLSDNGRMCCVLTPPGHNVGQGIAVRKYGPGDYASFPAFDAATPYLPGFAPRPEFRFG